MKSFLEVACDYMGQPLFLEDVIRQKPVILTKFDIQQAAKGTRALELTPMDQIIHQKVGRLTVWVDKGDAAAPEE